MTSDRWCLISPDRVWQSREPIDGERLCCKQYDSDFDDREVPRFCENPKRNDHGGRPGRRMIDTQEDHDRPGKRKSQGRRQNARPVDFTAKPSGNGCIPVTL